jgi:TLC domain
MLHIEYLIPIFALWHTITTEVRKYKHDHGVANNMVSAIHCVSYIAQYTNIPDRNYTIHVSIGYYIYDLLYLLYALYAKKTTQVKQYTIYVLHHFIVIYMLLITLTDQDREPLLHTFFLAELSNITLYLSYHLHKEYPQHGNIIRATEFIQLLWYSYFRVYRSSLLLYNDDVHLSNYSIVYQCSAYLLYLMGIFCSVSLVKKNIANCRVVNPYRAA